MTLKMSVIWVLVMKIYQISVFVPMVALQVMLMPVSITAYHDRLQLTDLKLLSCTLEQGEILQVRLLNLKHLYFQLLIGGLW